VPAPADLRRPGVSRLELAELGTRMLEGVGHEPVLARIVAPRHVPYIAAYVRHLGR
jgi:hypothetical protein